MIVKHINILNNTIEVLPVLTDSMLIDNKFDDIIKTIDSIDKFILEDLVIDSTVIDLIRNSIKQLRYIVIEKLIDLEFRNAECSFANVLSAGTLNELYSDYEAMSHRLSELEG